MGCLGDLSAPKNEGGPVWKTLPVRVAFIATRASSSRTTNLLIRTPMTIGLRKKV